MSAARMVKALQEKLLTNALTSENIVRSLVPDQFGAIPYVPLAALKQQPRSLSAAAGPDPLIGTVVEDLATKMFKNLGLVGEELARAVEGYVDTLILSKENLKGVALAPMADMKEQMVLLEKALSTLGLTLSQALSEPKVAYEKMRDKLIKKDFTKIAGSDEFVKMFKDLALFANTVANSANSDVYDAIELTKERLIKAAANAKQSTGGTKSQVSGQSQTPVSSSLFGPGLDRQTQLKPLVVALVKEIKEIGFAMDLFEKASADELQLIAGYLLKGTKRENDRGRQVEVASRKATDNLDKATAVIKEYFDNIVESADYVTLQAGFVPLPIMPKPKAQAEDKVKQAAEKLNDVSKKITDDFVNDLNMFNTAVTKATSGQIPMLEVPVIEEKITQVSNDISEYLANIAQLIIEAVNMPLDELLDLQKHLSDMPTDIRDQLSAATKLPFEKMFEHIETLIFENIVEMADDAYDAIIPVVNNTPAPSAILARTVAESLAFIEQEIFDSASGKGRFKGISAEIDSMLNKITTLTEDQLLELQLLIELIANDSLAKADWVAETGKDIQNIYTTISNQIKKLQTVVQNTTPPVTPATPQTGGGSTGGGRKPPVTPPAGGGGGVPPMMPNYGGAGAHYPSGVVNNASLIKAYQYVGLFLKVFTQVHAHFAYAVLKILPFGMTFWNIGRAAVSAAKGTFDFLKYLKQTGSAAKNAGKGWRGFLTALKNDGTRMFGEIRKSMMAKLGGGIKSGARGAGGGLSNQLNMGLSQGINMATMNMGTAGMIGGNLVEGLLRGLSAIPYVGKPAVAIIAGVTGSIALLSKTQKTWGSKSGDTLKNFRESWKKIKDIFKALLKPLEDFVGVLIGGTSTAVSGTDKARSKLESFSSWLNTTLTKVKVLVETKVAPAFRRFLAVVVSVYRGFMAVFGGIFDVIGAKFDAAANKNKKRVEATGKATSASAGRPTTQDDKDYNKEVADKQMEDAKKKLKAGIGQLTTAIGTMIKMLLTDLFIQIFKWAFQLIYNIVEIIPQLVLEAMRLTAKGIFIVIKLILKGILLIPKGITTALGKVIEWFGNLAGLISRIPGMGFLKGVAKGIKDFGKDISGTQINWFDGMLGAIDTAYDGVSDGIDGIIDATKRRIGSSSDVFDAPFNFLKNYSKKKFGKELSAITKDLLPEGAGEGLFSSVKNMLEQAFKNPETAKAAGEALKDALAAVKDAKIQATIEFNNSALDAVSGKLGEAVNKIKDELTEQLTAQKDASLKVFDDQIEAINALAEAEQSLTATEAYETNRRKMIRENELRRQNNRKDRSLAIYEGRIDDARSLDLQELKDSQDFSEQLTDLDSGRQRELQSINRNNAIEIIKAQREAASKQFDQAIKDFEKYSEKLLENGTFTEEQFKDQVTKMLTEAGLTSTGIQTKFTELFTALPAKIQAGMDPITAQAGFFSTGLESLRTTAATKFGLATGVSDPNSILGITTGMLGGIGSSVSTAFAVGGPIQTSYGTGLDAVNAYVKGKTTGTGPETTSSIFTQAITDAAAKMVAEAKSKEASVAAAAAKLVTGINDELAKIQKDALSKAIAEAGAGGIAAMKKAIQDAKDTADTTGTAPWAYYWKRKTGSKDAWQRIAPTDRTQYGNLPQWELEKTDTSTPPKRMYGGLIPYAKGGATFGSMNAGIPAILHGGEFVIRKSAVDKYGMDMLSQINKGMYAPKVPSLNIPMANYSKIANSGSSQQISTSESNHNYNFYVDNFIGETEWFNTMMKEYNVKVVPANQKQAGLESRVVKSYNGINRGL